MLGLIFVISGAVLCTILGCIGSARGIMSAGIAAAGVTSEKPELFGKVLVIQALPGTQGIYGFLTAILSMSRIGLLGGSLADISTSVGIQFFLAMLPIGVLGIISAIFQGKLAVSAIHMIGKQPDAAGKGITMTAMVETYAILALLISILLIYGIAI